MREFKSPSNAPIVFLKQETLPSLLNTELFQGTDASVN